MSKYTTDVLEFIKENYDVVLGKYYVPKVIFLLEGDELIPVGDNIPDDLAQHMVDYLNDQEMTIDLDDMEGFINYRDAKGEA